MSLVFIGYLVCFLSLTAFLLNTLLLILVWRCSRKLGTFKYMLLYFVALETCYSIVVFVTLPVFYGFNYRVVVSSDSLILPPNSVATFATGVYCIFYELWIGCVTVLFIFKYVVLCREHWAERISQSLRLKIFLSGIYLGHVAYTFVCSLYWCLIVNIPEDVKVGVRRTFNMSPGSTFGYLVLTLMDHENEVSPSGIIATANHLGLSAISATTIIFCGYGMYKKIATMKKSSSQYRRDKQIFWTLVLQALIPLIMYQIPTLFILTSTLLYYESFFGSIAPFMSVFTTLPKVLDPISIMLVIKEYRVALISLFKGRSFSANSISSIVGNNSQIKQPGQQYIKC